MTPTEPVVAHKVLVVDDDGAARTIMNERLKRKGPELVTAFSATDNPVRHKTTRLSLVHERCGY